MIYGIVLLFGMAGTLRLPELAANLPTMPVATALAALLLVLVGYGFEVTLVSGLLPQEWVQLVTHASSLLAAVLPH
jgi:NADH:ubiquinone oxidoreductase subunit 2 (subunit N)